MPTRFESIYSSPERDALLRKEYIEGVEAEEILEHLNALPGREMPLSALFNRTRILKVQRSKEWKSNLYRRLREKGHEFVFKGGKELARQGLHSTPVTQPKPFAPLPRLKPIVPLKDGGPSLAGAAMREQEAIGQVAWADPDTVQQWWAKWKGNCPVTSGSIDMINAKRQEFGLPKFAINERGAKYG